MRKYIVAGNWKMNTTVPEGVELAKAVVEKAKDLPANVELVVAPPFTHLWPSPPRTAPITRRAPTPAKSP